MALQESAPSLLYMLWKTEQGSFQLDTNKIQNKKLHKAGHRSQQLLHKCKSLSMLEGDSRWRRKLWNCLAHRSISSQPSSLAFSLSTPGKLMSSNMNWHALVVAKNLCALTASETRVSKSWSDAHWSCRRFAIAEAARNLRKIKSVKTIHTTLMHNSFNCQVENQRNWSIRHGCVTSDFVPLGMTHGHNFRHHRLSSLEHFQVKRFLRCNIDAGSNWKACSLRKYV